MTSVLKSQSFGGRPVTAVVELKRLCSLLVLNRWQLRGWSLTNLFLWHVSMSWHALGLRVS